MLSRAEVLRRSLAIEALAAELRSRGRHVSQDGAWMWAARVRLGRGREIGVNGDGFVWQKGGCYVWPPFARVDDIPHAAGVVEKEIG
ncbi:hypothetical protein SMC26_08485 [Actinomadura fulvescens]|uniref:Uncharacterized protein n=1 Tax=Actinomadura fulvescens TaxID=46160 RepID=A0ABP6D498_9ACTN